MKHLSRNINVNCNKGAEAEEDKQIKKDFKAPISRFFIRIDQMERENCWVWFKGSLKEEGVWKGGFLLKKMRSQEFLFKIHLMHNVVFPIGA